MAEDAAVLIEGSEYMSDKAANPCEDRVLKRQEGLYHGILADPTAEDSMQVSID
jgi:hypothetical protein